jgi:hypothetical protein
LALGFSTGFPQVSPSFSQVTPAFKSMIRSLIGSYMFVFGVIATVGTQISVHQLEAATATQCKLHDWPVKAHEVHMAWCAANNYRTN